MTVRVAVIGCGWWATFAHLPAIVSHPSARLVAVCDADLSRARAVAGEFDVGPVFQDAVHMLDTVDCDAVVIAVPNTLHYEMAMLAIERRKHVLIEKPMVIDPAHGRRLIEAADAAGVQVVVGYEIHYNPQVVQLRQELALGRIGSIEMVECSFASVVRDLYAGQPDAYSDVLGYTLHGPAAATYAAKKLSGGGQGHVQTTHAIALLLWMTGLRVNAVSAFASNAGLDVDLVNAVAVEFEGGCVGTIVSTGGVAPNQDEVVRIGVFGTRGHVLLDVTKGTASIHDAHGVEVLPPLVPKDRQPEWGPLWNLVNLAAGSTHNSAPGEIGLATAETLDAMYRSVDERRIVDVGES